MLFLNAKNCWQQIHKPTIVQHNDRDLSKKSGFPFPSGFRDFEKTNQTEQTVNRKKSGFRTAPNIEGRGFSHHFGSKNSRPGKIQECSNLKIPKNFNSYFWFDK